MANMAEILDSFERLKRLDGFEYVSPFISWLKDIEPIIASRGLPCCKSHITFSSKLHSKDKRSYVEVAAAPTLNHGCVLVTTAVAASSEERDLRVAKEEELGFEQSKSAFCLGLDFLADCEPLLNKGDEAGLLNHFLNRLKAGIDQAYKE